MIVCPQERFRQVTLLFQEALLLPPGPEREAWLDSKCGADVGQREEVAALLESDAAVRQRTSSALSRSLCSGVYRAPEQTGSGGTDAKGQLAQAVNAGRFHRAQKFVSFHKPALATVTLLTMSLVAGLLATLWEARMAERRFADARELVQHLQFDLRNSLAKVSGSAPVQAEMARHSLEYLDRLSAQKIDDPVLLTEIGEGYAELGAVLGSSFQPNLGDTGKARESFRKAIAILGPVVARNPDNLRARLCAARSKLELGRITGSGGGAPEGLNLVQQAAREFDEMAQRWPSDFEVRSQAAVAFQSLGTALGADGAKPQNLSAALDALRKAVGNASAAALLRPQLAEALVALATDYNRMGDLAELRDRSAAVAFYRQALGVLDRMPAAGRDTPQARNARSSALLGLGWNLGNLCAFTPALAALEEARQIRGRMSDDDIENTMSLYFRTFRNHRRGPLPSSQAHQPGLSADHNKESAGSTPSLPTLPAPKPPVRLTGIQRWEWINVPNLP